MLGITRRRFDGDYVAGLADGMQGEGKRFLGAAGDDDVFWADGAAQIGHAARDLLTQSRVAGWKFVTRGFGEMLAGSFGHGAVDCGDG